MTWINRTHADEDRFSSCGLLPGHPGRFVAPRWRYDTADWWKPPAVLPPSVVDAYRAADRAPTMRTHRVEPGDVSLLEAQCYAGRIKDAPARSMTVYDEQTRERLKGVPYFAELTVNIAVNRRNAMGAFILDANGVPKEFAPTTDWCIVAQHNVHPGKGERGRIPPFSVCFGLVKGRGAKLWFSAAHTPKTGSTAQGMDHRVAEIDFLPGPQTIRYEFLDSDGQDDGAGFMRAFLSRRDTGDRMTSLAEHRGPTGHVTSSPGYFSCGAYRSPWVPGREVITVTVSKVSEGRFGTEIKA